MFHVYDNLYPAGQAGPCCAARARMGPATEFTLDALLARPFTTDTVNALVVVICDSPEATALPANHRRNAERAELRWPDGTYRTVFESAMCPGCDRGVGLPRARLGNLATNPD
jgi:hypothetical protein